MNISRALVTACAALAVSTPLVVSSQTTSDNPFINQGYASLKGRKVVYIPIAMNYDITQAWYAGMKREADRLGYQIAVKDPNWSTDAAVQAFQAAIREKPDLIVTLPPDVTSLSRMVKQAQDQKIRVIEIQQITSVAPDLYVGTDWFNIGVENANAVVKACGSAAGKNGKVAIITGPTTGPASISWVNGIKHILSSQKDISVVATQAADWDASKSHAIATTVLQQHGDLCAILDVWDGDATGSASAVKEAGKAGKVFLATNGGGEKNACDAIAGGSYSYYVSFDAANQARYVNALVKTVLQSDLKAPSFKAAVLTPNRVLTKETLRPDSCWTVDAISKTGG